MPKYSREGRQQSTIFVDISGFVLNLHKLKKKQTTTGPWAVWSYIILSPKNLSTKWYFIKHYFFLFIFGVGVEGCSFRSNGQEDTYEMWEGKTETTRTERTEIQRSSTNSQYRVGKKLYNNNFLISDKQIKTVMQKCSWIMNHIEITVSVRIIIKWYIYLEMISLQHTCVWIICVRI